MTITTRSIFAEYEDTCSIAYLKKLKHYICPFTLFSFYRRRQIVMERRKEEAREALELERKLKLNRQKIMREFKERQFHTIEILPAGMSRFQIQHLT